MIAGGAHAGAIGGEAAGVDREWSVGVVHEGW
jgi:hypothetical protein